MTSIKAIAPWFGGKRGMAPEIVRQIGGHRYYFEPFCGSLAVLFAKPKSSHEVVCDLHLDVANLARVLQYEDQAVSLYDWLQRTLFCEALFAKSLERLKGEPTDGPVAELQRAYDFFVVSWMGRGGDSGTTLGRQGPQMAMRWTQNGGPGAVRFRSAIESIPAWHDRLRNVQILCRDAFGVLPKISDEPGVAIYADPPYPPETLRGDARYEHDFEAKPDDLQMLVGRTDDHESLAYELRRFEHARVVVSCYDCDRYRRLYDGWTFIDCARGKNLHSQGGRGSRRSTAPEVLIVNGEAVR